jgi:cell fate regulator YaaT (PSP1 superfamily)
MTKQDRLSIIELKRDESLKAEQITRDRIKALRAEVAVQRANLLFLKTETLAITKAR